MIKCRFWRFFGKPSLLHRNRSSQHTAVTRFWTCSSCQTPYLVSKGFPILQWQLESELGADFCSFLLPRQIFLGRYPEAYFKILHDLGYAQSHRYGESQRPQNLDDAIASGQELVRMAPKDGKYYKTGLLNLTSRLRIRYEKWRDPADHDEVMRLMSELLLDTSSDSIPRAY